MSEIRPLTIRRHPIFCNDESLLFYFGLPTLLNDGGDERQGQVASTYRGLACGVLLRDTLRLRTQTFPHLFRLEDARGSMIDVISQHATKVQLSKHPLSSLDKDTRVGSPRWCEGRFFVGEKNAGLWGLGRMQVECGGIEVLDTMKLA